MNRKQVDKLMMILISGSTFLILVGAFFSLQHYAYGQPIFWIGILTSLILNGLEIDRLKRIIKELEK
jgi:hypothetical protein